MKTVEIAGGYIVPDDTHIGKWQQAVQRLDHDEHLLPLILAHLPEGGAAIDIGAFDGDHTIAYARKAGKTGIVIAIEPGELAHRCLLHNVAKFPDGYAPTLVLHRAIGAGNSMSRHQEAPNLGASRLGCCSGSQVMVRPLDAIFDLIPTTARVNLIKIDVEGWELEVLMGAPLIIEKHRPVIVLEVNAGALAERKHDVRQIHQKLTEYRYSWTRFPEGKDDDPQYDIIATPWPA